MDELVVEVVDLEDVGDVVGVVVVFDVFEVVEVVEVEVVVFFGTVVEEVLTVDEGAVDDVWLFILEADDLPIFNI